MKKLRILPPTYPIEIFYQDILVKLPVKSLLRFKGVCKHWNDLIKEPHFARMYLDHTKQQNNSDRLMIYSYPLHEYYALYHQTIGGDDDDGIQAVKLHYPIKMPKVTTIAGSVNGLVCTSTITDSSTILLWNPTTGVHKILPPHPDVPVTGSHGIGFGYNSTADDYNVVRVVNRSRIDIYSLRTNSWKLFMRGQDIPGQSRRIQNRYRVCSVDGSIYWLTCHNTLDGENFEIACFDLKEVDDDKKKKKLIRKIPMPHEFDMKYAVAELKVMGGCLSMFKVGLYIESLEMWSMMKINETKNDEAEYRWINRVVIREASSLMYGISNPRFIKPICFSKDGKIVIRIPDNTPTEFVVYDNETKSIKNLHPIHQISEIGICKVDKVHIEESQMYIESLVSPNFS